ncbi:MAG: HlyD family type I secretion periplasmic adaptor subunit [Thiomicrospira sp.]|nr:HlyD family type I secretion periplasmic adaptor subunit [Thiomicrospira sp.]
MKKTVLNQSKEASKVPAATVEEGSARPKAPSNTDIEGFKAFQAPDEINIDTNDRKYARYGWLTLFVVFILFGGWATFAPLDSASVAPGEVVVVSNNKVVQHYEGGLVAEILIKEGDVVKAGDVLIKLSPTQAQAELSMIKGRLNEVYGLEARLLAEQQGLAKIVFPEALMQQSQEIQASQIMMAQEAVFQARKEALKGEESIYTQRIRALEQQIAGLSSYVLTLGERIVSYEKEIIDWEALYKEQFTDKIRLQEMQRELARLKGERDQNLSEIARLEVQITENEYQIILTTQRFQQEVASELPKVQAERVDLVFRKLVLEDRLQRIEIVSPVDGVVKGLQVYTIGSVIRPGDTLMEIVPQSDDLALKVRVPTTDIDRVRVGLIADVRFSAFNSQFTHVVEGEVIHVSADKFTEERTGMEYYEAKIIITEKGLAQMKDDGIFVLPGMPVEAMIKVGERTVLGYFIKPFQDMFARSFREE